MSVRPITKIAGENPLNLSANPRTFSTQFWLNLFLLLFTFTGCSSPDSNKRSSETETEQAAALPFSENSTIFEINPADSEARFLIDEIFHGEEKRVIGKTNGVSGQIAIDFADPSTAAVGPIQVEARTLETDNNLRNRAIQNRILLAGIYENITFTPTAVNGLPENIVIGEVVEFQIEGELTITAHTQPVTFAVKAVPISETRLEGSTTTTINLGDFELVVPSATGVAAVGEAVILELDFVATAEE